MLKKLYQSHQGNSTVWPLRQSQMLKVGLPMCECVIVTVCGSLFSQEPCPPYPLWSLTQQWKHHFAGLLINSPAEPFSTWRDATLVLVAESMRWAVGDKLVWQRCFVLVTSSQNCKNLLFLYQNVECVMAAVCTLFWLHPAGLQKRKRFCTVDWTSGFTKFKLKFWLLEHFFFIRILVLKLSHAWCFCPLISSVEGKGCLESLLSFRTYLHSHNEEISVCCLT